MYLQNKYTLWYYSIIQRAKTRNLPPEIYVERHHIIPRSLGGNDDHNNIVTLTAREHFICHLLLTRMTTGSSRNKMISAVFYLTGGGNAKRDNRIKNSILYEKLKIEHASNVSKQKRGCRQPPRTIETKHKLSKSKTGYLNPQYKGDYITPWGVFPSSRLASKACPDFITDVCIINFCKTKNNNPINLLSVCRSKAYLTHQHIGKTPAELGFGFSPYDK